MADHTLNNWAFLRRHDLRGLFTDLYRRINEEHTMADTFANDEARLEADVTANTAAIQAVGGIVQQDAASIAALKQQIADLQAQAPSVDTTQMEATLSALEANNSTLQGLVPAAPAPAPPAPPTDSSSTGTTDATGGASGAGDGSAGDGSTAAE